MLHTKKRSEASLSDDYQTPRDLFAYLCEEYNVDPHLDVCADARNSQCIRHLTEHDNALKKEKSLVFSIRRTKFREEKFHWIGPISRNNYDHYLMCYILHILYTQHTL